MLKNDGTDINPKLFLFVNPYEVNPGNSQAQQYRNCTKNHQTLPVSPAKTDIGEVSSCDSLETRSRSATTMEMEEFSYIGDLILSPKQMYAMDEPPNANLMYPEEVIDFTNSINETSTLEQFVDAQESGKDELNQLYADKNINNIFAIQELTSSVKSEIDSICTDSIDGATASSNMFNNHNHKGNNSFTTFNEDHRYYSAVPTSPSDANNFVLTPQSSPNQINFNEKIEQALLTELNLGVKLFVGDTLNTPDILESVVSLEDDRFNFLNRFHKKELQTINDADLKSDSTISQPLITKNTQTKIVLKPKVLTRTRKRKKYDDDDEDYIPPYATQSKKKTVVEVIESDSESEDERHSVKSRGGRSKRISSVSSDSSKDSCVSKYRELRDKNNEASRKSRLKRKTKEKELESEAQDLETRNVKLKTEVEELQRMVDNFRSNLFKIMLKK